MHGSVPTRADKLREGKGIMTVILVDLRRRHDRVSMARLDADHGHAGGAQRMNQPRREWAGLDADPRIRSGLGPYRLRQNGRISRALAAPNPT